jgi:NTE family protein
MHFCHIISEPSADQIPMSDAEFSRASIAERRADGYSDMKILLERLPWKRPFAL